MLLISVEFVIFFNKNVFKLFVQFVSFESDCLFMQRKILYKIAIIFHEDEFNLFCWAYLTSSGEWDCSLWM